MTTGASASGHPLRVLIVTPTLGIGGAERLVVQSASAMAAAGVDVHVAHGPPASLTYILTEGAVRSTVVGGAQLRLGSLRAWRRDIRMLLRAYRPDVVWSQSVTAAVAVRLAMRGVPQLMTLHGIEVADERLAALLLRLTGARVTAVSDAAADGVRRFRTAPPIEVLRTGVDVANLERAVHRPADPERRAGDADVVAAFGGPTPAVAGSPRLVCVARQHPAKGVDVLLAAFPRVLERFPAAALVLVGVGEESLANRRRVRALGIEARVEHAGWVSNAAPYLAGADVVVLPSRREGLPVTALEAFALGRPVVASAVGGTPTIVRPGETGWLVPPDDPAALAEALISASADPVEAARRGAVGKALVIREYALASMLDRVTAILADVAGRSPS